MLKLAYKNQQIYVQSFKFPSYCLELLLLTGLKWFNYSSTGAVQQYYDMTQTQFSAAVNQKCQQVTRNKEFSSLNEKTQAKKTGEDKSKEKEKGRESIMVFKNSCTNQPSQPIGPKKKIQAIKAGKDISRKKKSYQVQDNSRLLRSHTEKKNL